MGEISDAITFAGTFAGLVGALFAYYKWRHSARFSIAILPLAGEEMDAQELFTPSLVDEIHLKRNKCVKQFSTSVFSIGSSQKRYADVANERLEVPFIFQNVGSNIARTIFVVFRTSVEDVSILDFVGETFEINDFFSVSFPEDRAKPLKDLVPDDKVVRRLTGIGLKSDYLTCVIPDAFSGGAFELAVIRLHVPKSVESFDMIFRVECPEIYHNRQVMRQTFVCCHKQAAMA